MQNYMSSNSKKQAAAAGDDHSNTQIQTDELTEESAKAVSMAEKEDQKQEEEVEPQTPEQFKAALAAMEAKKDPKIAIKSVKKAEIKK